MKPTDPTHLPDDQYVGKTNRKDPVLSPLFADLHDIPRACWSRVGVICFSAILRFFTGALLRAGNDVQLVVFEALPHAFWYHFELPETKEALELRAKFFDERVGR